MHLHTAVHFTNFQIIYASLLKWNDFVCNANVKLSIRKSREKFRKKYLNLSADGSLKRLTRVYEFLFVSLFISRRARTYRRHLKTKIKKKKTPRMISDFNLLIFVFGLKGRLYFCLKMFFLVTFQSLYLFLSPNVKSDAVFLMRRGRGRKRLAMNFRMLREFEGNLALKMFMHNFKI